MEIRRTEGGRKVDTNGRSRIANNWAKTKDEGKTNSEVGGEKEA